MKRAAMDACGTKALDLQVYDWQVRVLCSHAGFVWHCCMRCRLPVQPGTRLRCTVQGPGVGGQALHLRSFLLTFFT